MTERGAAMLLGGVRKGFTDKMIFANRLEKSGGVRRDMRGDLLGRRALKIRKPWGRNMRTLRKIKESDVAGKEWARERMIRDKVREETGVWDHGELWTEGRHIIWLTLLNYHSGGSLNIGSRNAVV